MLENWKAELGIHGFISEMEATAYSRKDEFTAVHIWELVSRRASNELAIKMGIWVVDPFLDWAEQNISVAITGFLTESGADIHENALGKWWKPEDEETALITLTMKGIPRLLEFSQIDNLIENFEKGLTDGVPNAPSSTSWTAKIAERLIFGSNPGWKSIRRPIVYNYYLSVLYYHKGNLAKSHEFASIWLDFVTGLPPCGGEPERTYKHLKKLQNFE